MIDIESTIRASMRVLALGAILLAAPAHAADAGCAQWDLSGRWVFEQTNDTGAILQLQQDGSQFHGDAQFTKHVYESRCIGVDCDHYENVSGPVVGTINGDSFEATVYWNDNSIGVYTAQIGAQGLMVGNSYDKRNPQTTAEWHSTRVAACSVASTPTPQPHTGLELGRAAPRSTEVATPKTLCDAAASARARNSPAAPSLEKQCAEQKLAAGNSGTVAFGRIKPAAPSPPPSPAASAPVGRYPPVVAPNDLAVARISYSQAGQAVEKVVVGMPVTIACSYVVSPGANALSMIQDWRGNIQTGGQVAQSLAFAGDTRAGLHEADVSWTPSAAGTTPVSCELNGEFEGSEINGGNNRLNAMVEVVAGDEAAAPAEEEAPAPAAQEN